MHVFEHIGQPAKEGRPHDGQQEILAVGHDHARDGQGTKCDGIGPVRGTLKRGETLDLSTCFLAMQFDRAFAKIKQSHRTQSDQQQRSTIRNDDVVAHLTPRLTGRGQARAGVLHKGLDQVAGFWRLAFWQAGVAIDPLPHSTPHGRIVTRLHLCTLGIGLVFVFGVSIGAGRQLKDVGAFDAQTVFSL